MPTILKLPAEMFPLVASHLPLQHLPNTLHALALTCSSIHLHVQSVLYRKVVIKNEDHAYQLLERIATDSTLGLLVRELHIRIDLSVEIHKKRNRSTVLIKLQKIIENDFLPRINFFSLVLIKFIFPNEGDQQNMHDEYRLSRSFWSSLRSHCPNLRGLSMDGIEDSAEDPWVDEPDFCDLKDFLGLSTVAFKFDGYFGEDSNVKHPLNITNLASSLQSLTLSFDGYEFQDAGSLFSITFPHLKFLSFCSIALDTSNTEEAMVFWARHPSLEQVRIYTRHHGGWFSTITDDGFLPNLSHLRARFTDVSALASRLGRLQHLSITYSLNCQIPYLLREAIEAGLPNLKSLEIYQQASSDRDFWSEEGAMWHETKDGKFLHKRARKSMDSLYINSIVQGAPNIEELCLHGHPLSMKTIKKISPILGRLKHLKRFYYWAFGNHKKSLEQTDVDEFTVECQLLGNACRSLTTVTDVSLYKNGPYLMGTIIRDCEGSVEEVVPGRGFGMEYIGGDTDPFPLNVSR